MKTVAVLLSGGGARGALQLAAVERLAPIATAWAGTSVGAINACAAASGRVRELVDFWGQIDGASDFQRSQIDVWGGLTSLAPLEREMRRRQALQPRAPTWVGVYDYQRAEHRLLRLRGSEDQVWAAVRCSASIPIQHEPAAIGEDWLGDGGIDQPLPPVPPGRYDEVHAVFCAPDLPLRRLDPRRVNGPLEQAARAIDHLVARSVALCHARLRRYKRKNPGTRVYVYEPVSWDETGPTFAADRTTIRDRIEHGRWMANNPVEVL